MENEDDHEKFDDEAEDIVDKDFSALLRTHNRPQTGCVAPKEYYPDSKNTQQQELIEQSINDMIQIVSEPHSHALYVIFIKLHNSVI